ncbi:unnamed protein product, partial [Ixodes hexagonus]
HGCERCSDQGLAPGVSLLLPVLARGAGLQERRGRPGLQRHDAQAPRAPAEHPPPLPGNVPRNNLLARQLNMLPAFRTSMLVEKKESFLQVTLQSTNQSLGFRGFLIRAMRVKGNTVSFVRGHFDKDANYQSVRFIMCDVNEN